jgi:DnaJ like chaperone protein
MLYELAGTDAEIDAKEDAIIAEIAINMGIGANEQSSVRALYFEEEDGPYKVLGLKRSASEDEIKHAFHLLVNQYHPDKVAHLGAEFMKIANEKFVAIKEAYDEIKKEKGL